MTMSIIITGERGSMSLRRAVETLLMVIMA